MLRLLFAICYLLFAIIVSPAYALTPAPTPACNPAIPGDCPAGLAQIEQLFSKVVSVAAGLGFIVLLVMLVWAGFKYLMSGGEPKAVSAAHQTVTWALLGIVFMALAWLILQLIKVFTGIEVTFFDIRSLCGDPSDKAKWFCGNF